MKDYEAIYKRTKEIKKIFKKTKSELHKLEGDKAFLGLQIFSKYTQKNLIGGADHDIIWSISVEQAIELNVSDEDFVELAKLNWHMDEEGDCFACFV